MVQTFSVPGHPYFPPDADIPHYIPSASSLNELLVRFASLLSITIFTALWLAARFNPQLRPSDKFVFGWFVLCEFVIELLVLDLCHRANLRMKVARCTASLKVCGQAERVTMIQNGNFLT